MSKLSRIAAALPVLVVLLACAGCLKKHVVFYSESTCAIDLGFESHTQSPKMVLGYKRSEGVVLPVQFEGEETAQAASTPATGKGSSTYQAVLVSEPSTQAGGPRPSGCAGADDKLQQVGYSGVMTEAYSIFAKFRGKSSEDPGQWFATGQAATALAMNPSLHRSISIGGPKTVSRPDPDVIVGLAPVAAAYERLKSRRPVFDEVVRDCTDTEDFVEWLAGAVTRNDNQVIREIVEIRKELRDRGIEVDEDEADPATDKKDHAREGLSKIGLLEKMVRAYRGRE